VEFIIDDLAWGRRKDKRRIRWPIHMRVGKL
jgi:hypothetical protein